MGGAFVVDTGRAATQDYGNQLVFGKLFGLDEARVKLAIDMKFTDTTSNQVGVLRSKVQNCDLGAANEGKISNEK